MHQIQVEIASGQMVTVEGEASAETENPCVSVAVVGMGSSGLTRCPTSQNDLLMGDLGVRGDNGERGLLDALDLGDRVSLKLLF